MIFDESWLSELIELQKKASEMAKGRNSADDIQGLVKTVLNQWGISGFPWEQNSQSQTESGSQKSGPFEAKNDAPYNENHYNIDIAEKKQTIEIKIQIPGILDPNDLQIKLSANTLKIAATPNRMTENEGSFSRKIRLPSEVTPIGALAEYKDNYLTVTLPKMPPEGEIIPFDYYPSS